MNFGLVSLDQDKAFDRVDHEYLFNVMSVFGFGESFLTCGKLLYAGASCMVKGSSVGQSGRDRALDKDALYPGSRIH